MRMRAQSDRIDFFFGLVSDLKKFIALYIFSHIFKNEYFSLLTYSIQKAIITK